MLEISNILFYFIYSRVMKTAQKDLLAIGNFVIIILGVGLTFYFKNILIYIGILLPYIFISEVFFKGDSLDELENKVQNKSGKKSYDILMQILVLNLIASHCGIDISSNIGIDIARIVTWIGIGSYIFFGYYYKRNLHKID